MTVNYVVLCPKASGSTSKKYVVVHTEEYVAVYLKEKAAYDFFIEHDTYDSANRECIRLIKEGT